MNTPWYQEAVTDENEILSSRVRLARNIKKYPFRRKLSTTNANDLVAEATDAVTSASGFFRPLDIGGLGKTEQTVFLEKHIISPEFLNGNLPKGLLISDNQNISVMINEEDHVRIQSVKAGDCLENAFETASQIDDLIEERVEFAFHTDYGYLTACPTNTGTGLRASYMIHLPCLSKSDMPTNVLPQITKFGVAIRGIYGEGTAPMGSIYQISNQNTLGKSEHDIILGLQNVTQTVIAREQHARQKLLTSSKPYMEDLVHRAYGVLTNARLISAKEAMDLLSDIRLGYITGILDKPRPSKHIYQIMMEIQPGHLQRNAGTEMTEQERDITRAKYLREIFEQ
ncbi:MAG: protein arginine kinase [Defluviitaleaceae bacterium]|nr:protein arginine kinase [Defluviitaleaceae bacterium]MCL2263604.1 protein arginine kinase [Defluviitaleaceae bacterium]